MKSGIENPSKSEVIGHCGGDEKTEWPRRTDKKSNAKKAKQKKQKKLRTFSVFDKKRYNVCLLMLTIP